MSGPTQSSILYFKGMSLTHFVYIKNMKATHNIDLQKVFRTASGPAVKRCISVIHQNKVPSVHKRFPLLEALNTCTQNLSFSI